MTDITCIASSGQGLKILVLKRGSHSVALPFRGSETHGHVSPLSHGTSHPCRDLLRLCVLKAEVLRCR